MFATLLPGAPIVTGEHRKRDRNAPIIDNFVSGEIGRISHPRDVIMHACDFSNLFGFAETPWFLLLLSCVGLVNLLLFHMFKEGLYNLGFPFPLLFSPSLLPFSFPLLT